MGGRVINAFLGMNRMRRSGWTMRNEPGCVAPDACDASISYAVANVGSIGGLQALLSDAVRPYIEAPRVCAN